MTYILTIFKGHRIAACKISKGPKWRFTGVKWIIAYHKILSGITWPWTPKILTNRTVLLLYPASLGCSIGHSKNYSKPYYCFTLKFDALKPSGCYFTVIYILECITYNVTASWIFKLKTWGTLLGQMTFI